MTIQTDHWVLAVEDSETDMYLLQLALNTGESGPQIERARDGEQALEQLHELAEGHRLLPDWIVLDLNLPRVEGHEVLEYLRSQEAFREVPVVIVTSSSAEADRKKALAAGADAYFVKPLDLASYRLLSGVMEQARQSRSERLNTRRT